MSRFNPVQSLVSRSLRAASNGKACLRCGIEDGTICGRHYAGIRQHLYGKGRGKKCHDFAMADLCTSCDAVLSEGAAPKDDWQKRLMWSEEFQHYCLLTLMRRFSEGVLAINRGSGNG